MLFTNEKKSDEINKKNITMKEKFNNFNSSIFFPNQTSTMLDKRVADAQTEPNCPWEMLRSSLTLELNKPIKKLCPKLEKNVNINPNKITL